MLLHLLLRLPNQPPRPPHPLRWAILILTKTNYLTHLLLLVIELINLLVHGLPSHKPHQFLIFHLVRPRNLSTYP